VDIANNEHTSRCSLHNKRFSRLVKVVP